MCEGVRLAAQDRQEARQPVNDSPQVDVEHPTPIIERLILDQVERRDARVVAQHVDPPEAIERRLAPVGRRMPASDTSTVTASASAPLPRRRSPTASASAVEVGEHDCRARGGECLRERAADAAGRAGHHRDPPGADHAASADSDPTMLVRA